MNAIWTRPNFHCLSPQAYTNVSAPPRSWMSSQYYRQRQPCRHCCRCQATAEDGGAEDLASAFNREIAGRQTQQQAAQEQEVAREFDGRQLLQVLRRKYDRSYDVGLVQRKVLGKQFIALNIMWRYREQASFALSEEEYMDRLDGIAAALRAWGKVKDVTDLIASSKSRPRVGKAISIPIELPEDVLREWFLIH